MLARHLGLRLPPSARARRPARGFDARVLVRAAHGVPTLHNQRRPTPPPPPTPTPPGRTSGAAPPPPPIPRARRGGTFRPPPSAPSGQSSGTPPPPPSFPFKFEKPSTRELFPPGSPTPFDSPLGSAFQAEEVRERPGAAKVREGLEAQAAVVKEALRRRQQGSGDAELKDHGVVYSCVGPIAYVRGLADAAVGHRVRFADGSHGVILRFDETHTHVAIQGNHPKAAESDGDKPIAYGSEVTLEGPSTVSVGPHLLGRVVDSQCTVLQEYSDSSSNGEKNTPSSAAPSTSSAQTSKGKSNVEDPYADLSPADNETLTRRPLTFLAQTAVHEQIFTGLKVFDFLCPLGKGSRTLITGPKSIPKAQIGLEVARCVGALNDSLTESIEKRVHLVYVSCGRAPNEFQTIVDMMRKSGSLKHTTVVAAHQGTSIVNQYLAPYTGMAIGEYYRDRGLHSLVIIDDVCSHSIAEVAVQKASAGELYFGNMYGKLFDRFGVLSRENGYGSLSGLIIATPGLVPKVNRWSIDPTEDLIAACDSHIKLSAKEYEKSHEWFPVDLRSIVMQRGIRVLGRPALRVSQHFRTRLLEAFESQQHLELREQIGLDPDDLHELREKSYIAEKMQVLLQQRIPMTFAEMFVSMFAVLSVQFRRVPLESVKDFQKVLLGDLRDSQLAQTGSRSRSSESVRPKLESTNHDRPRTDEAEPVRSEQSKESSEASSSSTSAFSSLLSSLFGRSSPREPEPRADQNSSSSSGNGDASQSRSGDATGTGSDVCLNSISADEVVRAVNLLDPREEVPDKVQVLISRYLEALIDAHPEVSGKGVAVVDFFDDDELDLESLK